MNGKILLVSLVIMVGAIGVLNWKLKAGGTTKATKGDIISLSTNPDPLGLGQATFIIDIIDKNGKPVDGASVSFNLNMTTMNMGIQQGSATPQGGGRYSAVGRISMSGPWRVSTKIITPDKQTETKDFIINVQ